MVSATMADVAREAGVSVATVGRAIHQNGYVSPEAREKIEEAVRRLGYVPNQMARTLKSSRSSIIGSLVIQNPNGLYYEINQSVAAAARAHGFELLTVEVLSEQRSRENFFQLMNTFIGLQAAGLVIISCPDIPPEAFEQLKRVGIPAVAIERGYPELGVDSLLVRDHDGVYDAVRHIAAHGHKRVAMVGSALVHEVERQRLAGFRDAAAELGLATDERLIRIVDSYTPENGRRAAEALLALDAPPTAVFTAADTLAAGMLQVFYERGLRVPEDISIVGYDNILSRSLSPPIDSVALVLDRVGEDTLSLLMERMDAPASAAQIRSIDTRYVDRGTVTEIW